MKKLCLTAVLITVLLYLDGLLPVFAQQSEFTRVFYDPLPMRSAQVYSLIRTPDSNYLLGGYKDNKPSVIKMDPSGNIIWSRNYSDTTGNIFSMTQTNDAHFILAGNITDLNGTQSDLLFMKISQEGDTTWSKIITMGSSASALFIIQTSDNGFITGGFFEDSSPPYPKAFIMKLDAFGNLSWCKGFSSGKYSNTAFAAAELPGGNYIVTGSVGNGTGYSSSLLLMKVNPEGEILWSKKQSVANNYMSSGNDLQILPDGILCYFTDINRYMALMKTDTSGNVLWSRDVGYEGSYAYSRPGGKICQTSDGGYILMNAAEIFGPFGSAVKVDSNGDPVWAKDVWILPSMAIEAYDKGLIIAGNGPIWGVSMGMTNNPQIGIIKMNSSGNSSYCVQSSSFPDIPAQVTMIPVDLANVSAGIESNLYPPKYNVTLDSDTGCVAYTGGIAETAYSNPLKAIPNPSNGEFRLELTSREDVEIKSFEVYNTFGELVSKYDEPGSHGSSMNLVFLPDGIYEIRVIIKDRAYFQKFIIIH